MSKHEAMLSRRSLIAGAAGLAASAPFLSFRNVIAQSAPMPKRIVLCDFRGGWDVLMHGDPRDPAVTYPGVNLGTNLLVADAAKYRDPISLSVGGVSTLWGAPMQALVAHRDIATIFRGINMNTVAHPTGLAYMNTGLQPSGSNPRGSSIGTVFAAGGPLGSDGPILPFVSIQTRTYNDRYPSAATALRLANPRNIVPILGGDVASLPQSVEALLAAAREDAQSCVGPTYAGLHPADEQLLSRERLARLQTENFVTKFDFGADNAEMAALRMRYGITNARANDPSTRAATAAALLKTGLARSVAVQLQGGLDTHTNWADLQPQRLEVGFNAMAALIEDLREDDPDFEHTIVMAHSEFARTPRINGNEGRDHWFAGVAMVFGGLRPAMFGATNPDDLGLVRIDPNTGLATDNSGLQLRPEHVFATVVAASGLDASAFRVDPLQALLPA